jgi:fatty-acyl-CoA synthase
MRLEDYLDKGASLRPDGPCLTMEGRSLSYRDVQRHSHKVAHALAASGIRPGEHVAILADNDAIAFASVFGIARAKAVWCPMNPRNGSSENVQVLQNFDCVALLFHSRFADIVAEFRRELPLLKVLVCLDAELTFAPSLEACLRDAQDSGFSADPAGDVVMIAATGGTTGVPKGVLLSDRNLETMTAHTLIGYPFNERPVYLAMAPLTHAAGVLTLPIMALGGEILVMPKADIGLFLSLIEQERVTHTFLPPTLIYMMLDHPELDRVDLSSLKCFWYGAAPISSARLAEALTRVGPVMAQLFGQSEAPMMISMLAPADHFMPDGSIAHQRLASAGRPGPLVEVATMSAAGELLLRGETGEIVVRGSIVMKGYYKNPEATREASSNGWHRTGDIGYIDPDNFVFLVDRAKDMIISGGFNIYSAEVERALMQYPGVQDCAVFGVPDDKWGERVCAVIQLREGSSVETEALLAAVKSDIGSIKAPKSLEIWPDLPRSPVGKILKKDIRRLVINRVPD